MKGSRAVQWSDMVIGDTPLQGMMVRVKQSLKQIMSILQLPHCQVVHTTLQFSAKTPPLLLNRHSSLVVLHPTITVQSLPDYEAS